MATSPLRRAYLMGYLRAKQEARAALRAMDAEINGLVRRTQVRDEPKIIML